MSTRCRLCGAGDVRLLYRGDARAQGREFLLCARCDLVFVPDEFLVTPAQERARYLKHRNDPGDEGYRSFLGRLLHVLVPLLPPGARGLDYGCGPTPVLMTMLGDLGFPMRGYDLYFRPDDAALRESYDFITCVETAEHFRAPLEEFERMAGSLRPAGVLGLMTALCPENSWSATGLARWHYISDETHICFYSPRTMAWLAQRFAWSLRVCAGDVVIMARDSLRDC